MKIATNAAAQGDCILRKVKAIPAGFTETKRKPGEQIIVTHSETGHHHVVNNDGVRLFEPSDRNGDNALVCYLQMGDVCDFTLEHLRPYDTHEAIQFKGQPGDVFEVRRQREYSPEGWRRVQD